MAQQIPEHIQQQRLDTIENQKHINREFEALLGQSPYLHNGPSLIKAVEHINNVIIQSSIKNGYNHCYIKYRYLYYLVYILNLLLVRTFHKSFQIF